MIPSMLQVASDPEGKWLYRTGGISALALGIAYLAIIALYVPIGAPPHGAAELLSYLSRNTRTWWAILGLSVLTDFLFVPLAFSLYLASKGLNRNVMLLATACVALFVFLDLALTWTNYAALITFSGRYAAAANDAQRSAVVEMASYPIAILQSGLLFVYNTLVLAVGIAITSLVMRKGVFSKPTAYLGLLTGILGTVSVVGTFFGSALSAAIILTSVLTTVWVSVVGYRLCTIAVSSEAA